MIDMTDMAAGPRRPATLGELLRIPARRWTTVLALALLGAVAALGYLLLTPATYRGSAVVVVRPVVADPFSYPGPGADRAVNMNVENGIATGGQVVDAVAAAVNRRPDAVRAVLEVEVPVGTQLLRFDYTGRSAGEAVRGANAAATSYLRVRGQMYADQRAALLASYDAAIAAANAEQAAARKTLPGGLNPDAPTPPAVTATIDRLRALNDQLTDLAAQRAKISAVDVTPGTVSRPAGQPVPSSTDAAPLYLLAALLGGVLLGAVLAYAQESVDRRVRSLAEAEEVSGLPALATLRRARRRRDDRRAAADLRYAAMAITARLGAAKQRRVVLLAARAGEVDAALVAGLATALAAEGQAVRVEGAAPGAAHPRPRLVAAVTGGWRVLLGAAPRPVPRTAIAVGAAVPAPRQAGPTGRRPRPYPQADRPPDGDPAGRATPPLLLEELSNPIVGIAAPYDAANRGAADGPWAAPPRPGSGGSGRVRMDGPTGREARLLTLVTTPPAESDEQGVRAAADGAAVLVVARDLTRVRDLRRLADRLRIAGTRPLGILFLRSSV